MDTEATNEPTGRYRLDAINDKGHTVEDLPAAYVVVAAREQAPVNEHRNSADGGASFVMDRLERQVEMLLARVEALETENASLRAENAELKRRLGENSSNSSKPQSSDSPADRDARPKDAPTGNPRGGQRGHKGHKRTFLPVSRVRSSRRCDARSSRHDRRSTSHEADR